MFGWLDFLDVQAKWVKTKGPIYYSPLEQQKLFLLYLLSNKKMSWVQCQTVASVRHLSENNAIIFY